LPDGVEGYPTGVEKLPDRRRTRSRAPTCVLHV